MKNIELYHEPLDIFEKLKENMSEMTEHESAFLCGVIKKVKPKKILEVGVAAGGSTICILSCLDKLNLDCEVFSCDLNEEYYRNQTKKTGYLLHEVEDHLSTTQKHKFFFGDCLPNYIDNIGRDIDLVLIDTVHSLPGEILDFLTCAPYLSPNAVIVLHDLCLNLYGYYSDAYATKLLFDVVVSDEKHKNNDEDRKEKFSNIGMFQVTSDTFKYIENVFSALSISWSYYPGDDMVKQYLNFYKRYYPENLISLFIQCCNLQKELIEKKDNNKIEKVMPYFNQLIKQNPAYLYGTGTLGARLYHYIQENGGVIKGFITSRKEVENYLGKKVYSIDEFSLFEEKDSKIILAMHEKFYSEINLLLHEYGLENNTYPAIQCQDEIQNFIQIKSFIKLLNFIEESK
jgi:predicted O-methyltransferase YrrM